MKGKSAGSKVLTPIFIISAAITAVFAVASLISPTALTQIMTTIQTIFAVEYGWFAMLIPFLCMVILIVLGVSRKYGHIVIGGQGAKADYSMFTWIAMLFTSSIGMGIIYFGVNEPIYAYALSPGATEAPSVMEAAREAMGTALYHWGVSVWAIFSVAGLVFAYFVSKHKTKYLAGDILKTEWKGRKWSSGVGGVVNVLACVCSAMTIAATMGLGSVQISTGIVNVFGLPDMWKTILPYLMLAILVAICLLSSTTKTVGKGMAVIGNWNVYICIFVLVFAIVTGPTRYIFEQMVQTTGTFFTQLVPRNFQMFIFGNDPTYGITWDVVNNMWWISWTPFMAVFIASISKGRTIRQFAFATMTIPVAFMLVWHCTFGGVALLNLIQGDGSVAANALTSADMTFFALLKTLPLAPIMTVITVVLLLFFLATTVTSAALSLGRMTDPEGKTSAPVRCAVWVVLMGLIALTGIFSVSLGGNDALNAIKSLATTLSYPYMFFFILLTVAFLRQLKLDEKRNPTLNINSPGKREFNILTKRIKELEAKEGIEVPPELSLAEAAVAEEVQS